MVCYLGIPKYRTTCYHKLVFTSEASLPSAVKAVAPHSVAQQRGHQQSSCLQFGVAPILPLSRNRSRCSPGDLERQRRYYCLRRRHFEARDGQALSYRHYPGTGPDVVVLIHGSSGESSGMHAVAKTLSAIGDTRVRMSSLWATPPAAHMSCGLRRGPMRAGSRDSWFCHPRRPLRSADQSGAPGRAGHPRPWRQSYGNGDGPTGAFRHRHHDK